MLLKLFRTNWHDDYVQGKLFIDDVFQCFTLERPRVMIPSGTYPIILYQSPANHTIVPLLQNVPGRTMIEMHVGNFPEDSKGCILVGRVAKDGCVEQSKMAFADLMSKLSNEKAIRIMIV